MEKGTQLFRFNHTKLLMYKNNPSVRCVNKCIKEMKWGHWQRKGAITSQFYRCQHPGDRGNPNVTAAVPHHGQPQPILTADLTSGLQSQWVPD